MSSPTRRETLPTQHFPLLFPHPSMRLKEFPYPQLAPQRKQIRSSIVIAVQTGTVRMVRFAFGWADAEKITSYPGITICLGDPLDSLVPQSSTRNVLTLPEPYVAFFERLNSARPNPNEDERGVVFERHLPAGVWLAFKPAGPQETYGVMEISDGQGENNVFFFASKESADQILADHKQLSHENVLHAIDDSALPELSRERHIELTGDLADWIMVNDFLSRP